MNKLDKDYQNLVKDILENGVIKSDRTGTGTISLFGKQIRHKMSDGFPLLTTKKMPFKTIVTELLWFLRGDSDIRFLWKNNCHIWNGDWYKQYSKSCSNPYSLEEMIKFGLEWEQNSRNFHRSIWDLGPIYGRQWRNWDAIFDGGIDQITNLINDLKTNPDSRRLIVSAWNVSELDKMILPPCHNFFQMYSIEKEGKRYLSIMVNIRSNDIPLGLPFNIASYGLLLEIIAKEVNMISDELIINIGDAHIYLNQIEGIKEQLNREPFQLPKLKIKQHSIDEPSPLTKPQYWYPEDFVVGNYQSHPTIKLPLSN
jgi:thymidylate synthase